MICAKYATTTKHTYHIVGPFTWFSHLNYKEVGIGLKADMEILHTSELEKVNRLKSIIQEGEVIL